MKKLFLMCGIALMALSSCSKDEIAEPQQPQTAGNETTMEADFKLMSDYVYEENEQWAFDLTAKGAEELGISQANYALYLENINKENQKIQKMKDEGKGVIFAKPATDTRAYSFNTSHAVTPWAQTLNNQHYAHILYIKPHNDPFRTQQIKIVINTSGAFYMGQSFYVPGAGTATIHEVYLYTDHAIYASNPSNLTEFILDANTTLVDYHYSIGVNISYNHGSLPWYPTDPTPIFWFWYDSTKTEPRH